MKIIFIAGLLLALVPRGCADENEEIGKEESIESLEGVDYVAKDMEVRKAVADWKLFLKQSDSAVHAAKKQISEAVDKSDEPKLNHNLKFRNEIYRADRNLEQLSEKLLRAEKFEQKDGVPVDEITVKKMEIFKKDFNENLAKLNSILTKLKTAEHK